MSIPKRDPNFTESDLRDAAQAFLEAGLAYWEAAHKAGINGAITWCDTQEGGLALFTRGEYRETLLRNIQEVGQVCHFGSARDA